MPLIVRLLKIEVDIGTEKETMATGLGDLYKPEELEGLTALFLVNLEPKKIGSIESHGMIIAVERADKEGAWCLSSSMSSHLEVRLHSISNEMFERQIRS